jgi:hypothetical protein
MALAYGGRPVSVTTSVGEGARHFRSRRKAPIRRKNTARGARLSSSSVEAKYLPNFMTAPNVSFGLAIIISYAKREVTSQPPFPHSAT